MKVLHNIVLAIQWVAFLAGLVGSLPLAIYHTPEIALLALIVSFLALACLKLEVVSFLR